MTDDQSLLEDAESRPKGIPQFLKILTILTLIGSAWAAYQTIKFNISGEKELVKMEEGIAKMEEGDMPDFLIDMTYRSMEILQSRMDNTILLTISDLIGLGLCVFGALQMRKLQKTGYYAWLVGEVLPIIISLVIIGTPLLHWLALTSLIIPGAFAFMYYTQLKFMK